MRRIHLMLGLGLLSLGAANLATAQQGRGQRAMENLDSDGDGIVNFTEFQENSPDILANLDTDGDNAISLDEFLSGRPSGGPRGRGGPGGNNDAEPSEEQIANRQERMQQRATEQFSELDLDGDGLLSTLEFQEATFLRMDSDGDGVLSADELRRRGPGGPGRRGGGRGNHGSAETEDS